MLPPVSEPSATRHSPAATAAAEPPEEPPGTRSRSQGLCVGKKAEFSVDEPIANSSMFALPTMTAPGVEQALRHEGVVRRHEVLQHARAAGRAHALRADDVLDADGDAGERRRLAAGDAGVGVVRLPERDVFGDGDVRLHAVRRPRGYAPSTASVSWRDVISRSRRRRLASCAVR